MTHCLKICLFEYPYLIVFLPNVSDSLLMSPRKHSFIAVCSVNLLKNVEMDKNIRTGEYLRTRSM